MLRPVLCSILFFSLPSLVAEKIAGVIYDQQGATVSGVRVMLMQDYVKQRETKSGEAGEFAFDGVAPGMYQVQAKQPRFGIWQQTVQLEAGQNPRLYALLFVARADDRFGINGTLPPGVERRPAARTAARAGGKVDLPRLLSGGRPHFPQEAARRGLEGDVALAAIIKTDGSLDQLVTLGAAPPELEAAAREELKKWRYSPMALNGTPVECGINVVLSYKLR